LLFHGPAGAGKRTRILALLKEIYGVGAGKLKVESKTFKHESKVVEVSIVSSKYHLEFSPGDVGNNDTFVIQDLIKEVAQTHVLGVNSNERTFKGRVFLFFCFGIVCLWGVFFF
jgi:replication factor C subunit 3/5